MSRMSKVMAAFAVMAMASGLDNSFDYRGRKLDASRNSNPTNFDSIQKSKGLKQFFYGENSLWAINKNNADRKARSLNWL